MPRSLFDQVIPKSNPRERLESPREAALKGIERVERRLDAVFERVKTPSR